MFQNRFSEFHRYDLLIFEMEINYKAQPEQITWKHRARLPYCDIFENPNACKIAEGYRFPGGCPPPPPRPLLPHIVQSLGTILDPKTGDTFLLIERIPNRLSEVVTVNENQMLKVLYAVYMGLAEMENLFGVFNIS